MSTLLYLIPALIFVAGAIFFFQGFNFKGKVIKSKSIAIILGVMFLVTVNKFKEENNPTPPPTPKVEKTPEQIAEEEKETKLRGQIYLLKEVLKKSAKDPDSMKFRNEGVTPDGKACVEANGKNGFGGYAGFSQYCVFTKNGKTVISKDGVIQQ